MLKTAASLAAVSAVAAGCATSATTTVPSDSNAAAEKRRREINSGVDTTLARLYSTVRGSRELVDKASGILVFPSVIAAGLVVGAQYGEGALRIGNSTAGYYSLTSVSIGLQIGAQSKALTFLFMTQDALDKFRTSNRWMAGAEASVAILRIGANGSIDVSTATAPVLVFVLTNTGLMANLSLEGTKITPLKF